MASLTKLTLTYATSSECPSLSIELISSAYWLWFCVVTVLTILTNCWPSLMVLVKLLFENRGFPQACLISPTHGLGISRTALTVHPHPPFKSQPPYPFQFCKGTGSGLLRKPIHCCLIQQATSHPLLETIALTSSWMKEKVFIMMESWFTHLIRVNKSSTFEWSESRSILEMLQESKHGGHPDAVEQIKREVKCFWLDWSKSEKAHPQSAWVNIDWRQCRHSSSERVNKSGQTNFIHASDQFCEQGEWCTTSGLNHSLMSGHQVLAEQSITWHSEDD